MIRSFGSARTHRTIAEVAELTGLTRAVARRYLLTLLKLGYVAQEDSEFTLAPRISELGFAYLSTIRLLSVVSPHMQRLVDTLHESCSVAVLDHSEIVYIAEVPADRLMSINIVVGSRQPAHITSAGKVLIAYLTPLQLQTYLAHEPVWASGKASAAAFKRTLAKVREQGWAISDGELEEGVRDVAVPILDRSGHLVAAISLDAHAARVSLQQLKRNYLPPLRQTAVAISDALARLSDGAAS